MTPGSTLAGRVLEKRLGVIEASAGTGKTYTLESLVVELIVSEGIPIEKILAVTFTEKATLELKSRVRRKLEESLPDAAGTGRGEGRREIERALAGFDSASVFTIHSFCQRILLENAFFHRRLFEQELVDGETIFKEAFRDTLRRELATDPVMATLLRALRIRGKGIESFEDLLLECAKKRAAVVPTISEPEILGKVPAGDWDDPDKASAALAEWQLVESAAVQRALPKVLANLRARKAEAGNFDYQDMLDLVAESLDGPFGEELKRVLRERYSAVLVDEFQDTDAVQWKVFSKVFLQSEARHRLYVIGDPKQAIYGFRGASVETYRAACEEMKEITGESGEHRLEKNFRSSPSMIDALNTFFGGFFDPPQAFAVSAGREETGLFGPDGASLTPVVLFQPPAGQKGLKAAGIRRALAHAMANEMKALRAEGVTASVPENRRLNWSDFFILAGKNAELVTLARALEEEGIPAVLFKQDGLFSSAEARCVRDLLFAIADPEDRSRRAKALLTPFFGLSLQTLLDNPGLADSEALLDTLSTWKRLGASREFAVLFSRLLSETRLASRELFLAPLGQSLTNYRQLFEFLLEELSRTLDDLPALALTFDSYVRELRQPAGEDSGKMRLPPGDDAVRLLTFHKAKGLEAPVVFVCGGFTKGSNHGVQLVSADPRAVWVGSSPDRDPEKTQAERLEDQENQRLMYVAMTRAKVRLYLPYFPAVPGSGKAIAYSRLNGAYSKVNGQLVALDGAGRLPGTHFARVTVDYVEAPPSPDGPDLARLGEFVPTVEPVDEEAGKALREAVRARRGFEVTSYTGLKAAAGRMELLRGGVDLSRPRYLAARAADGDVREPGGVAFGVALHEILEKLPLESLGESDPEDWFVRPDIAGTLRTAAENSGFSDAPVLEKLSSLAVAAVTTPLVANGRNLGPLLAMTPVLREAGFHFPIPESYHPAVSTLGDEGFEIGRGVLKGFIDVLFAHEGRTYLLDWKSDWLPSYEPEALAQHVRQRYELQLRIYSLALTRMLETASEQDFESRFGGFFFAFPRAMDPARHDGRGLFFARPSWNELQRFEDAFRSGREAAALLEEGR
ncbi:MAG: UvrD-helicase domain-containing protein [Thermoanaerobaculia bacterium]|nr:UvrD-helicase domain-containing protein [Thermoanaerobaculia bacterium]